MPGPIDFEYLIDGGEDVTVLPPASTQEYVASGASLSAKTFSAFTDTTSLIDSYSVTIFK